MTKSEKALYREVEDGIKKIHPYETPEIIAIPLVAGSKEHLKWLDRHLRKSDARAGRRS